MPEHWDTAANVRAVSECMHIICLNRICHTQIKWTNKEVVERLSVQPLWGPRISAFHYQSITSSPLSFPMDLHIIFIGGWVHYTVDSSPSFRFVSVFQWVMLGNYALFFCFFSLHACGAYVISELKRRKSATIAEEIKWKNANNNKEMMIKFYNLYCFIWWRIQYFGSFSHSRLLVFFLYSYNVIKMH